MLTSLKRVFRSGFIGFWRNAFVSFTAILVITITLLVIGASILFKETLTVSLAQIQNKVDIKNRAQQNATLYKMLNTEIVAA